MKEDIDFKQIVESANEIIIVTEVESSDLTEQKIVYVNPAFTTLTEYTYEEAIGQKSKLLDLPGADEVTKNKIRDALNKREPVRAVIKNISKSKRENWLDLSIIPLKNDQGAVTHFASIERDITREKELTRELEIQSMTDPLTGLLNRRAFNKVCKQELSRFQRNNTKYCLLALDLDYFKSINDKYGHAAGDRVLLDVSTVFKNMFRPYDYSARVGGEEFCILLPNTEKKNAHLVAERIRKTISEIKIYWEDDLINLTISIGLSEISKEDKGMDDILLRADEALYEAKEKGRNCVQEK